MHKSSLFGVLAVLTHAAVFYPATGFCSAAFAACTWFLAQASSSEVPGWLMPAGNFAGIAVVVLLFLRYLADKDTKDRTDQGVREAVQRAWHEQILQRQGDALKEQKEDHRAALREVTERLTAAADRQTAHLDSVMMELRRPPNGGSK